MDQQAFVRGLAGSAIASGVVAVVSPGSLQRAYGTESSPATRGVTRLWGSGTVVLGILGLRARGEALDELLLLLGAMNTVDAVATAVSAVREEAGRRPALLTAASSALFAGLTFYSRTLD